MRQNPSRSDGWGEGVAARALGRKRNLVRVSRSAAADTPPARAGLSHLGARHGPAKHAPGLDPGDPAIHVFPSEERRPGYTGSPPERFASLVKDVGGRNKSTTVRLSLCRLVYSAVMLVLGTSIHEFSPAAARKLVDARTKSAHDAMGWRVPADARLDTAKDIGSLDTEASSLRFGLPQPDSRGTSPPVTENGMGVALPYAIALKCAQGLRCCACQWRSRLAMSAGLKWQNACSRA
jgi:hypothetical protein